MSKSYIPSAPGNPVLVQHCTDPRCIFPQHVAQILSVERLLSPSCAVVLLFCVADRIMYLLLTGWKVISVIIPTSMQHRLVQGTPAGSHVVAATANIRASQAPSTRPNRADMAWSRSLTPQIHHLLQGPQYTR